MLKKQLFLVFASLLILFLGSSRLFAQTSLNIPVGDRIYGLIDKLSASGLIKTPPLYGERPWTRNYAASLVKEALENREKLSVILSLPRVSGRAKDLPHSLVFFNHRFAHKRFIDSVLNELEIEFSSEILNLGSEIKPLDSISLTYTYLNNAPLPLVAHPPNKIDGKFRPLTANRGGNQYVKGQNFFWETTHSAQITPYFAAYVRPQFPFQYPSSGGEDVHAYIMNLYVKTGLHNVELEIGRDNIAWGEGIHGGLSLSDNPRGLDIIKLSSPEPFYFPWFFKYLGLFKITAFMSNLGNDEAPRWPWLAGYRMDNNMFDMWNLGFSQIIKIGGQGYATPSFGQDILELIGIPCADAPIDRLTSVDTKVIFDGLRGMALYGEALFQNYDSDKIGWMVGINLPRLDYSGKWGGRFEFERIGEETYTQEDYSSGWTINQLLMGNTTGPDSTLATMVFDYNYTPLSKLSVNFSFIDRSFNDYDEYHALNVWTLEAPLTKGHSGKPAAGINPIIRKPSPRLFFHTSIGWDYVVNQNFVQSNNKADLMVEAGLKLNLF